MIANLDHAILGERVSKVAVTATIRSSAAW